MFYNSYAKDIFLLEIAICDRWFLIILIITGTRSKRRGLDETGACANYVETEQVIKAQVNPLKT